MAIEYVNLIINGDFYNFSVEHYYEPVTLEDGTLTDQCVIENVNLISVDRDLNPVEVNVSSLLSQEVYEKLAAKLL